MPIALDTQEIHRYVFSTDRCKPEEQPTLLFYFPTAKEVIKIANKFDEGDNASSVEATIKLRCDAVRIILCGWQNFKDRSGNDIAYDPNKLDEVLTDTDLTELRSRLVMEMSINEREKKVSALSAQFKAASNAPSAEAANA